MYGEFGNFDGGHFENRPYWQFRPYRSRVNRLIMTREQNCTTHGVSWAGVHGNPQPPSSPPPPWVHGLLPIGDSADMPTRIRISTTAGLYFIPNTHIAPLCRGLCLIKGQVKSPELFCAK